MANIRKWMAEARNLERKGDLQAAIATYRKALAAQEETSGFADLALINGLGDLYRRAGRHDEALEAYERAAAQCEEEQLYANGIALCKKILRNAPEATAVYRRAGRLYARSGLAADARASYETYMTRLVEEGRDDEVRAARAELAELSGAEDIALELADELAGEGRVDDAVELLRSVKGRRDREGSDTVSLLRRIQELTARDADSAVPVPPSATPSSAPTSAGASSAPRERSGALQPGPGEVDADSLARELQDVLSRVEGDERFRRALPLIDHLLEIDPGRFDLLHRKLGYAYEVGDEAVVVAAYLALGECLDATLAGFTLRSLSTATESGSVTAAIKVECVADLAPGS